MIEMSWNEQKLSSFDKKMKRIINNLIEHVSSGVEEASEETRKYALKQKKGVKKDDMILKEINSSINEIVSRIYTNFKHAPFLEFGTGRYAEMPHIGKSKTFLESGFKFWYAPATSIKGTYTATDFMVHEGVFYPMITRMYGKTYVLVFEQQSRPFMRPAAFYMRSKNVGIINNKIKKGIISDIK